MKNIWQIGGGELTAPEDAAVYLIRFGYQAALIDAGCGNAQDQLVANISAVLPQDAQINHLFLTHCHYDHVGGAAALKMRYGCRIVAHALDAVYLESADNEVTAASWYGANMKPISIDQKIQEREMTFPIGTGEIHSFHCPGHSPGSVVYLVELDETRVLFGQDVHGPLHPSLRSNPAEYAHSLRFLLSIEADILCEGHFGILRGKRKIRSFIEPHITY